MADLFEITSVISTVNKLDRPIRLACQTIYAVDETRLLSLVFVNQIDNGIIERHRDGRQNRNFTGLRFYLTSLLSNKFDIG